MIQEASVMGLLKTVLIILLFYFGFKILARLFTPLLIRFVAKKAEQKFGGFKNQANQQQQQQQKKKEGETIIDKIPNQNKTSSDKVGEYIDYEELD
jgi:hypothetical protein